MIYKLVILTLLIIILQQHEINIWTTIFGFFEKISRSFRNGTEIFVKFYDNIKVNYSK
jgi:hypothetical protein